MSQELVKVFQNDKFGNIRVVLISGKEHFVASDVAKALGYERPADAVAQHCVNSVKHRVENSRGQMRDTTVIPEGDLYRLITHSKLPTAQQFERWVFDEVLPSIRKNGTYMTDEMIEKVLTDPDLIIKLATQLKEEKAARLVAEQKIEEQKPKVAFANAITASTNSILIRELARLISQNGVDMGEKKLYAWLRENGYVEKNSCKATQKAINLKVLELVERTNQDKEGNLHTNFTTYVTPKGQEYFVNKFISKEKQGA